MQHSYSLHCKSFKKASMGDVIEIEVLCIAHGLMRTAIAMVGLWFVRQSFNEAI